MRKSIRKVTAPSADEGVKSRRTGQHLRPYWWKPGQSGNPGGRTAELAEVQALARQASPEAMQNIIDKMSSKDERVSLLAADKVLERAWGKPKEQQGDTGPTAGMSYEERQRYIMKLLAYAASLKVPPEFEAAMPPVVTDNEEPER